MINNNLNSEKEQKIHDTLNVVYKALDEKGYNAISQLTGYILSGDPSYITIYHDARALITSLDNDDIMQHLLRNYFGVK